MFTPLGDRITVKRDVMEYEGKIILRDNDLEKLNQGTVFAIGPEVKDIKVGDKVIFGKYNGLEQLIDGEKILIMRESEVWGIVNG